MASSTTTTTATMTTTTTTAITNNPSNMMLSDTASYDYMRQFVDYQDYGIELTELSQIRTLDIYLQNCYRHVRDLVDRLRVNTDDREQQPKSDETQLDAQMMLIDALVQAKIVGDKKMQLSQQMLDTTERQSKTLKSALQKYKESINQQYPSTIQSSSSENNPNDLDSENEYDSEPGHHRSLSKHELSTKTATTSLWKRKTTTATSTSTMNLKRKCVAIAGEHVDKSNGNENSSMSQRDRKKAAQRIATTNTPNASGNGKKLKLNAESGGTPNAASDEPTYCLCSQLSYGSMILCDSKACEIKWFHFNCVNLTTKPKGKWFCPNCRDSRS